MHSHLEDNTLVRLIDRQAPGRENRWIKRWRGEGGGGEEKEEAEKTRENEGCGRRDE